MGAEEVKRVNPCQCICHEVFGGGAHENMSCLCKGGTGFDDMSNPGDATGDPVTRLDHELDGMEPAGDGQYMLYADHQREMEAVYERVRAVLDECVSAVETLRSEPCQADNEPWDDFDNTVVETLTTLQGLREEMRYTP